KKPDIPINENEIRITSQGLVRNYISYATTLLQERRVKEIVLKAMGQAISKTVAIAEIIKRNIPRLHQDTFISSISITDVWEPIEEGLLPVEMTRQVSMISITLSTRELNKNSPGYQAPLYVERPRPQNNNYQRQQQPRMAQQAYNAVNEGGLHEYLETITSLFFVSLIKKLLFLFVEAYGGNYHGNRGRGQGGGRGGRGRGWNRGGYGNQGGGYGSYQGDGYRNYQGGGGYGNYQGGRGYGNYRGGRGGYGNYQGGGEYGNYQGGGEYGNYQGILLSA
ncbi:DNA/RNA-binding protein Alba-like protein, partial [Cynara cardunculus var. scolymus]